MARAIIEIIEGRHPGLGAAGRSLIQQSYTWGVTLARLDACLDSVLATHADVMPPDGAD